MCVLKKENFVVVVNACYAKWNARTIITRRRRRKTYTDTQRNYQQNWIHCMGNCLNKCRVIRCVCSYVRVCVRACRDMKMWNESMYDYFRFGFGVVIVVVVVASASIFLLRWVLLLFSILVSLVYRCLPPSISFWTKFIRTHTCTHLHDEIMVKCNLVYNLRFCSHLFIRLFFVCLLVIHLVLLIVLSFQFYKNQKQNIPTNWRLMQHQECKQ